MLNKQLFGDILSHHPGLDCHLFASRLNFQISTYCSWCGDRHSAHIDAFTMNWSGYKFYAFPPSASSPNVDRKSDRTERTEYSLLLFGQHRHGSLSCYNTSTINLGSASTPESSETPLTQSTLPAAQETPLNGMSCVRGAFSPCKFSEEVTNVLMASGRSGMQKQ